MWETREELRSERRKVAGAIGGDRRLERRLWSRSRVPPDRFHEWLVRNECFFVAAADEDGGVLVAALAGKLERQSRLADAGLAGDQAQMPSSDFGQTPRLGQQPTLALASDERAFSRRPFKKRRPLDRKGAQPAP